MTQFDLYLRQALMDANLEQYENVIRKAESKELDASPRYVRERMRLLADPWDWEKRQSGRKRLDWRLIAIAAALLLLSACAYAVATGQFSQWFPRMGVDPEAPETSEDVLSRTGTVIQQSQTVGHTTVTLNAAIWDGKYLYLSFDIETPDIPEEVRQYSPLYPMDCRLILREDQMEEYTRNAIKESYTQQGIDPSPEQMEAEVQARLELEAEMLHSELVFVDERKENTLLFRPNEPLFSRWFTETKRPELTLHLGKIATYVDGGMDENGIALDSAPGEVFIEGPFDLTFTLEEPILPVRYTGAGIAVTVMDIPFRFTGFKLSVKSLTAYFDAPDPLEELQPGQTPTLEEEQQMQEAIGELMRASTESVQGLWTADGKYIELGSGGSSGGSGSVELFYPYPIDPATITAVNIGGVRVELSELEVLPE